MQPLAPIIYLMCLLTSAACAWLLIRSYVRNRTKLLLWSATCFALLAINNLLVVVDLLLVQSIDFGIARQVAALAAISVLLYGFIWEID